MRLRYLGDGLYASFENGQIKLMANDANFPSDVVYIELPSVWNALKNFVEEVFVDPAGSAPDESGEPHD